MAECLNMLEEKRDNASAQHLTMLEEKANASAQRPTVFQEKKSEDASA